MTHSWFWLGIGAAVAVAAYYSGVLSASATVIGELGYAGVFLSGALFIFLISAATGAALLTTFTEMFSIGEIAVLGGFGAAAGDLLLFKLVRRSSHRATYRRSRLFRLFHLKYLRWALPGLGAAIIASPLPDEAGVSLLGLSRVKTLPFLMIAFLLNAAGIFLFLHGYSLLR